MTSKGFSFLYFDLDKILFKRITELKHKKPI